MKNRDVRIKFDSFSNLYYPEVKMFNLFWTKWFNDGNGHFRTISSSDKIYVLNFIEKIQAIQRYEYCFTLIDV